MGTTSRPLSIGSFGPAVSALHQVLQQSGVAAPATEMGRQFFGPGTRAALSEFQRQQGLPPTGVADGPTQAALAVYSVGTSAPATAARIAASEVSPSAEVGRVVAGAVANMPRADGGQGPPSASGVRPGGNGTPGGSSYQVSGSIVFEHGLSAAGLKICVYQRNYGGTRSLLAEGSTDAHGIYQISYSSRGAPNIELYGVSASGQEVQLSRTKFGAASDEKLDLLGPSILQPPAPEFARLVAAVSPQLGNKPETLKDAVEWGDRRDISVIAAATGWDGRLLGLAATAYENAAATKIPVEALYGLYRAGFPTDTTNLARVDRGAVQTALTQTAQSGIIDAAVVAPGVQAFADFVIEDRLHFIPPGKLAGLSEFLKRAPVSAADAAAFAALVKQDDNGEDLWSRAKEAGVSDGGIAKLQLQGKLAYLTLNNADLVVYLQAELGTGDARQLIELDFDQPGTWVSVITNLASGDETRLGALIPPAFQGRTTQQRLSAYSEELARRVRQMDPNRVTMRQLSRGDLDGIDPAARPGVQAFLSSAAEKGFRLGQTALSSFIADNGAEALLPNLTPDQRTRALADVSTVHRLYSVSSSDKALNVLLKKGFRSAHDIVRLSPADFLRLVGPAIGSTRETQQIYWKAQQQSATVINVFAGAKDLGVAPPIQGLASDPARRATQLARAKEKLTSRYPTLESLFGGVDYCECEHCNSVLSPAAYLVDILHFIDPKEPQWTHLKSLWAMSQGDPNKDYELYYKKPFDALVERRPDVPNIALTCENTNTALPYIDIVNEVLELLVAPGSGGITAFDTGSAISQDLIAEPQNVKWEAYVGDGSKQGLNTFVYPTTLPFDLPLEMVRGLLKQLDLPLWKLREAVGRPETLVATTSDGADGLTDVWLERIGLGPADVKVLVGAYPWYTLYGYADENMALAELVSAKTLSRRLGISYQELVELLKTSFINPAIASLVVLHRLKVDPHDLDRYLNPQQQNALTPEERSAFEARLAAQQLTAQDLQPLWNDSVREQVVLLRSPERGCDFSETTLNFGKTPANGSAAMALVLLKLNVFVRLQHKLGWSAQLLDSALRVFVRPNVTTLTIQNWADTMKTALIYIAHLQELVERVGDRLTPEELLILWSSIPSDGVSSLYERLFLNGGIRGVDPVFDNRIGRYLANSSESISAHVDGVRQALQISHEEIEQIFGYLEVENAKLTIENLSVLMRHKVLARALDLSVPALLTHLALSATVPMSELSANPVQTLEQDAPFSGTLAFLRELTQVQDAGLTADSLEGICRHRGPTIDAVDWAGISERLLLALSALPSVPPLNEGADAEETRRFEDAKQRARLSVLQTLASQFGVAEPLLTTLVTNVLKDPATGGPLIDGSLALRAAPLPFSGTTWLAYVWFSAAGTYSLTTPVSGNAVLHFGPGDDVQVVPNTDGRFLLTDIRAGERYRLELTMTSAGTASLQGDAVPLATTLDDYARFATATARIRKAVDVLSVLGITPAELDYIRSLPKVVSLDALPLKAVDDDQVAKKAFAGLLPWIDLAAARRRSNGGDRVVAVLRSARRVYDSDNQVGAFEDGLDRALSALTGRKPEVVRSVRKTLGYEAKTGGTTGATVIEVPGLTSGSDLGHLTAAMAALIRLGLNPEDAVAWSKHSIDPVVATKVRASLKGRYPAAAWRRVAQPVFDVLRKKQRDALVAYLTHMADAPYGDTPERLFEYLLFDPGTEPPVLASRIQLAISSVQLFVQRCLMNLEPEVAPSIIDAKRWEWMCRYRPWEVNRKMYLWPNWLEPEFRDDKTHLYRDLESALLQGDVSDDLARSALATYLRGLEGIARLEMMTMYFEPGASADSSTVHVIGRTPNAPHKYFYRQCSHRMWTPWEPLGVEIDSEHLALTVWRGRMHLFLVTLMEKAEGKDGSDKTFQQIGNETPSAVKSEHAVQLQLSWVERVQGKWVNHSSTPFIEAKGFKNRPATTVDEKGQFFIHLKLDTLDPALPGDDVLEVHISNVDKNAHWFRVFSKLAQPTLEDMGSGPTPGPLSAISPRATKWEGEPPLSVQFIAQSKQEDGQQAAQTRGPFPILTQGGPFRLLFPTNEIRLDATTRIPRAAGEPSGYIFAPQGAQHVVYRGTDSGIHDLWWTPNGWFHSIASDAAAKEAPSSDPHGYPLDDRFIHCIAFLADRKVVEVSWSQLDSLGPDADEDTAAAWRMETLFEAAPNGSKPAGRPLGGVFTPKRGAVYRLADGSVWAAVEGATPGTWEQRRLNTLAGPAASDVTGVVLSSTSAGVTTIKSRHVFFRGSDGNIHELRSDAAGLQWSHTDLTASTGAPPPATNARPRAYAFLGQGTIHVVYRTQDGIVHELSGPGSWSHNAIGQPFSQALGDPTGYVTEFAGTRHVVYRGVDNRIHELWWSAGRWQENVLTRTVSRAPAADGDPSGYSFERQGTQHVVYRADDGGLRELWWSSQGWHLGQYDLATGGLDPIGPLISPFFYENQEAPQTFFVEPSLAEKTVHDWEEYVVTKEELVPKKRFTPFEAAPWFPNRIAFQPSELGVVSVLLHDRLFDDHVFLRTSKGVFGAGGGVQAATTTGIERLETQEVTRVLDPTRGTELALQRAPVFLMAGSGGSR